WLRAPPTWLARAAGWLRARSTPLRTGQTGRGETSSTRQTGSIKLRNEVDLPALPVDLAGGEVLPADSEVYLVRSQVGLVRSEVDFVSRQVGLVRSQVDLTARGLGLAANEVEVAVSGVDLAEDEVDLIKERGRPDQGER